MKKILGWFLVYTPFAALLSLIVQRMNGSNAFVTYLIIMAGLGMVIEGICLVNSSN